MAPGGEVVGSDFSEGMLERARAQGAASSRWEWGNALELPYADGRFDAATVGFGARNFSDLERGLAEMARVVRPGGRVVVLEITTPHEAAAVDVLSRCGSTASCRCSGALAGEHEAYTYLPSSVRRFPGPEGARPRRCTRAGLSDVRWVLTAGGIIALHVGDQALDGRDRRRRRPRSCEAGGVARPGRCSTGVEERLRRGRRAAHGAGCWPSTPARRSPPAASGCGRCWCSWPPAPSDGDGPACAPRPRSSWSTRRRWSTTTCSTPPAAPRPPDRGRRGRPRRGDRHRRPALLARLRRAGGQRARRRGRGCSPRRRSALARGRAAAARRRLERRGVARALPAPLRAEDRAPVRGRLPARARWRAAAPPTELLARFGRRIGLAFQLLDDVLDVSGPAERTGKQRGTDLLDGTVTLPLDPRPRARPGAGRARSARSIDAAARPRTVCDAIAATGALDEARAARAGDGRRGQGRAAGRPAGAPAPRARAGGRRRRRPLRLACGQPEGDWGARARDGRIRAWHAVSVNADRTSYDVWGAAIAVEAALSLLLCLVLVFIWGLTGAGYFWPQWVAFALAVPLAIQLAVRFALRAPEGRLRALALHGAASGWVAGVLVVVYLLAGGGTFWPLWAVATLALAFGAHAIVVAALPSLRPQERQLAARVDELTRTRARRPRRAGRRAAAHRARPARRRAGAARRAEHAARPRRGAPRGPPRGRPSSCAARARRRARPSASCATSLAASRRRCWPIAASRRRSRRWGARAQIPVAVNASIMRRPVPVVETAAYFVVAEALTNAAKHAGGAAATVELADHGDRLRRRGPRRRAGRRRPDRHRAHGPAPPRRRARRHLRSPARPGAGPPCGRSCRAGGDRRGPGAAARGARRAAARAGHRGRRPGRGRPRGCCGSSRGHKPDLAIVDVRLPPSFTDEGLRAALEARARQPGLGVLSSPSTSSRSTRPSCSSPARAGSATCSRSASATCAASSTPSSAWPRGGTALDREVVAELVRSRTGRRGRPGARGADAARARGARADGRGAHERGDRARAWSSRPARSRSTSRASSASSTCPPPMTITGGCWPCWPTCGRARQRRAT